MNNNNLIQQNFRTASLIQYKNAYMNSFTGLKKNQSDQKFFECYPVKIHLYKPDSYEIDPMKNHKVRFPFEKHPVKNNETLFLFESHPVKNCPGNPVCYEKKSMKTRQGSFFLFQHPSAQNHFITKKTQGIIISLKKLFTFCTLFPGSFFFLMIKTPYPLCFSQFADGQSKNRVK